MAQQLIDVARQALALGLHVFPLKPRSKHPATAHGFKNSSADPETITAWWTSNPEYNIGIDCGASGITVLDIDAGLESLTDLDTWFEATGLAPTYTVRTGRRTSYGVQMYFRGTMPSSGAKKWSLNGCTGEIKSLGGYVVGAGSIHPDSGQRYRVICDQPLTDLPDIVRDGVSTKKESPPGREPSTGKIPPGTWHNLLVSFAGTVFNAGVTSADGLYRAMLVYARENFDLEAQPLDKEHVAQIARNAAVTFEAKPEAGVAEDWEAIAEPKPEPTIDLEEPAKAGDILAIFPKAKELKYPELRFPYEAMSPGRFKDLVDKACEGGLDPGLVAPAIMGLASAVPYTDRMDGDRINFMVCLLGMVGSGKDMAINRGLAVLGMESYEGKVYKFYTPSGERNIPLQLCNRPGTKTEPAKAGPARFVFVTPELEETLKKSKAETSGVLQSMQYFYDHNNKSITGRHDETLEVNCRLSWVTALPVGNVEIDTAKFRRAWGEDCSHGMASRMILGFSETSIELGRAL